MNYFFGFDIKLAQNVDWFFNVNHLFLLFWVIGFIVVGCFLFHAKSEKGKKITKLILAGILFVLEVGRIIYKFLLHIHNNGSASGFNWWWNISFQMCAIMTWTTILTLVLSAFLKRENKFLQFLYNILFGCAMLGGILTFCYPDCMSSDRGFLHFLNIQTVTVHALLIFVPIYLIKIKEFKVEIINIWKVLAGYVFVGCVAMFASLVSGNNFAFCLNFDLFDLGIPFPWHLPIVMLLLFVVDALLYGGFEIVRLIRNKIFKTVESKKESQQPKSILGLAVYLLSNLTAILFGALILLGVSSMIGKTVSMAGIACLIGLAYMVLMLIFAEVNKKYISLPLDNNKKKHIVFIVLTMIFDLPVGAVYMARFLCEGEK